MRNIGIFAPARLGSSRLPNKQLLPIGDTNMFEICCQKLDFITTRYNIPTYVLICEQELIDIAKKYPKVKIVIRDEETAKVDGPLNFIYKDILEASNEDYLMFLNPCLIFLTITDIINAVMLFSHWTDCETATSVKPLRNWIWDEGNLLNEMDCYALNTKTIKPLHQCAHCFHIFNRKHFQETGEMLQKDSLGLITLTDECSTIDIDTKEEYKYAKWKWENEH